VHACNPSEPAGAGRAGAQLPAAGLRYLDFKGFAGETTVPVSVNLTSVKRLSERSVAIVIMRAGCLAGEADSWRAFLASSPTQNNQAQSERYARIRLLMRRQLDSFQGVTSSRWDELNRLWAVVVGALVLLVAQLLTADPSLGGLSHPITAVLGGISHALGEGKDNDSLLAIIIRSALGGALAPIAKDVISAISSISFTKK
jgi:hypothetical protein